MYEGEFIVTSGRKMKITTRTDGSERKRGRCYIENWHLNDDNNTVLKIRGKTMYDEEIERIEHLNENWNLYFI
jgi:hypothetical protein